MEPAHSPPCGPPDSFLRLRLQAPRQLPALPAREGRAGAAGGVGEDGRRSRGGRGQALRPQGGDWAGGRTAGSVQNCPDAGAPRG